MFQYKEQDGIHRQKDKQATQHRRAREEKNYAWDTVPLISDNRSNLQDPHSPVVFCDNTASDK